MIYVTGSRYWRREGGRGGEASPLAAEVESLAALARQSRDLLSWRHHRAVEGDFSAVWRAIAVCPEPGAGGG